MAVVGNLHMIWNDVSNKIIQMCIWIREICSVFPISLIDEEEQKLQLTTAAHQKENNLFQWIFSRFWVEVMLYSY